jgi:hypothetical protein
MNTDVRCDMVAFHRSCSTRAPSTGKIQVIGTLSSNMALTDMFLPRVSTVERNRRGSLHREPQESRSAHCIYPIGMADCHQRHSAVVPTPQLSKLSRQLEFAGLVQTFRSLFIETGISR